MDLPFNKFIRPGALTISLIIFMILMVLDGNIGEFTIRNNYLDILETLLTTMVVFYFSSRGIEKVAKTIQDSKVEINKENKGNDDNEDLSADMDEKNLNIRGT